ncbi:hypothetical protein QBC32DRAFT_33038 [Pseudoneurospora amorphoporcata]|uniref:Uncharacterized protein n=1 Tax=Pseudoneurospora amorphoporcata TaxID=241081 RepID=A0AAN6NPE9_9PEZI|nr:hypothetical protein QBC32DRAFT_33038 [Pseudoneurospora amorphoporcata]
MGGPAQLNEQGACLLVAVSTPHFQCCAAGVRKCRRLTISKQHGGHALCWSDTRLSQRSNASNTIPERHPHQWYAMEGCDRKMIKPSHSVGKPWHQMSFRAPPLHSSKLSDLALINHGCYHASTGCLAHGGIPSPSWISYLKIVINAVPGRAWRAPAPFQPGKRRDPHMHSHSQLQPSASQTGAPRSASGTQRGATAWQGSQFFPHSDGFDALKLSRPVRRVCCVAIGLKFRSLNCTQWEAVAPHCYKRPVQAW